MSKKICPRKYLSEADWWKLGYVASWNAFTEKVTNKNIPMSEEGAVTYRSDEVYEAVLMAAAFLKSHKQGVEVV